MRADPVGRYGVWQGAVSVAFACMVLACASPDAPSLPGPPPPPPPSSPFVVSNPGTIGAGAASAQGGGTSAAVGTAYVSLPPGALPVATSVTVTNRRTGTSAIVPVMEGGFDPVPIVADVGDTIAVTVHPTTPLAGSYLLVVPARARPIIVRVTPPKNKRDVPLNARIMITFSEPMDPTSLDRAITVTTNGSPIDGEVVVEPSGDVLVATFVPSSPLLPDRTYDVVVNGAPRDRDGDTLATGIQFDFSTAAVVTPASIAISVVTPVGGLIVAGDFAGFRLDIGPAIPPARIGWKLLSGPPGASQNQFWRDVGQNVTRLGSGSFYLSERLGPGAYALQFWIRDADGRYGETAPVTVNVVDPDPAPRLVVEEFSLIELAYPQSPGHWYYHYTPHLVVSDTPGGDGVELVGFELLDVPAVANEFPRTFHAGRRIPAASRTRVFGELDTDDQISFSGGDGRRSTGGLAAARITYRDALNHYYVTSVSGPIVAGELPTTYTSGCDYFWQTSGFWACWTP